MVAKLADLADLPDWPRWLSMEQAAAYVGVSKNTFGAELRAGTWPKPKERQGRIVWDKKLLDMASDRISEIDGMPPPESRLKKDWGNVGKHHGKD